MQPARDKIADEIGKNLVAAALKSNQ